MLTRFILVLHIVGIQFISIHELIDAFHRHAGLSVVGGCGGGEKAVLLSEFD